MTALLLLLGVVALVGLAAWLRQRRHERELSSISQYRSALSTLAEMQHSSARHTLRVFGEDELPPDHTFDVEQPRLDPSYDGGRVVTGLDGAPIYVFDDARPLERKVELDLEERRRTDWAINHMGGQRGRHPIGLWIAAGALTLVVVIGAIAESRHGTSGPLPVATSTTIAHTTTTVTPVALQPTSQSAGAATYLTAAKEYVVTVTPASPCWIQVTGLDSHTTPYAETVAGGVTKQLQLSEPATVSLGSPSGATATLDGVPLVFPPIGSPMVLTFGMTTVQTTTTTTTSTLPNNVLTGPGAG